MLSEYQIEKDLIKSSLNVLGVYIAPLKKWVLKNPDRALKILNLATKTAYRIRLLETHPDHHPDQPEKVEEFRKVIEAWEILKEIRVDDVVDLFSQPKDPIESKDEEEEEPTPKFRVFIEMRGPRIKITHEGACGVITSFVNRTGDDSPEEIKQWLNTVIGAMEKGGFLPNHYESRKRLEKNKGWEVLEG